MGWYFLPLSVWPPIIFSMGFSLFFFLSYASGLSCFCFCLQSFASLFCLMSISILSMLSFVLHSLPTLSFWSLACLYSGGLSSSLFCCLLCPPILEDCTLRFFV